MRTRFYPSLVALLALLLSPMTPAQMPFGAEHPRAKSDKPRSTGSRVQHIDWQHVALEIVPSFTDGTLEGVATLTGKVLLPDLHEIQLDASNLGVENVEVWRDGAEKMAGEVVWSRVRDDGITEHRWDGLLEWSPSGRTDRLLRITGLGEKPGTYLLARGDIVHVRVEYSAQPEEGWYFFRQQSATSDIVTIHTQGQPEEHHHWFPCFDSPGDLMTSEVSIEVPDGYRVLSNGVLQGAGADGLPPLVTPEQVDPNLRRPRRSAGPREPYRRFHWRQEQPHATYLLTVVIGKFDHDHETCDRVPLGYYVPAGRGEDIAHTFGNTPAILRCLTGRYGVAYPWPRYDQVVPLGYQGGGMENTGQTTLLEACVHAAKDSPDYSAETLIAHEMAHQWWGNLVTCEDWAHLWLHESFATYAEALWLECNGEPGSVAWELFDGAGWYWWEDSSARRPIVWNGYSDPGQMFNSLAYPKGGRVLHMLRHVLGDEDFFAVHKTFLERYAHQNVVTADLLSVVNEVTGADLGWFFDQWLYKAGHPEYRVRHSYHAESQSLVLEVEQAQKTDDWTPLFRMPVDVEVIDAGGLARVHRLQVFEQKHTFLLPCAGEPLDVRWDKGAAILAQVEHEKSPAMLAYQLGHDTDVMGRRRAAQALLPLLPGSRELRAQVASWLRDENDARLRAYLVAELGGAAGGRTWAPWEGNWGGRQVQPFDAAGKAWARDLVLAAVHDLDSRVRTAALQALVNFPGDPLALPPLEEAAAVAGSDYHRAAACLTLGQIGSLSAHGKSLREALTSTSHRELLERYALRALANLGDPQRFQWAAERLQSPQLRELRRDALGVLEQLGTAGDRQVVALLAPHVRDPDPVIRGAVVAAMGRFGHLDPDLAKAALGSVPDFLPQQAKAAAAARDEIDKNVKEGK